MPAPIDTKRERLHLRLDAGSKRVLERAAAYSRSSVSDFVLKHALEAADSVVSGHERSVLSDVDWQVFLQALEFPPEPSAALREGFAWYLEQRARG